MGERGSAKRVLVTGATGFVGRALVPALLAAGHRVRATTRGAVAAEQGDGALTWMTCDVNRPEQVARALEDIDAVFFLVHAKEQVKQTAETRAGR